MPVRLQQTSGVAATLASDGELTASGHREMTYLGEVTDSHPSRCLVEPVIAVVDPEGDVVRPASAVRTDPR